MSMRSSDEIRAELIGYDAEIKKIEAVAAEAGRPINVEELEQVEAIQESAKSAEKELDLAERREQAKLRQAETLKRLERTNTGTGKAVTTGVRESLLDDPKHGFKSSGEFYAAVANAAQTASPTGVDNRLRIVAAATGASFGDGSSLGFLAPPEFSSAIWDGLSDSPQSLLGMTDNYTVTGESLTFNANAETSRANGSRFGGVQGYWLAEADQVTASKPKVRQVKLEPQELGVLVYATNKLLNNASAASSYITRAATEEIAFMVGDAIINGDGVGKPDGVMSSGALVSVTRTTTDQFVQQDVANMWCRLHARMMPGAVWLINQDVLPELLTMVTEVTNVAGTENVGGFNAKLYQPGGPTGAGTLMGRPVYVTEYCATLANTGDVILANFGGYATGTRGGVDSAISIHLRFDYNESAFRFMFAVDGENWLASAQTPFKGANTLSNLVVLTTDT